MVTREGGVATTRSQPEAMIMLMLARFGSASIPEQLMILRYIGEVTPAALQEAARGLPENAIQDFVERLAREADMEA